MSSNDKLRNLIFSSKKQKTIRKLTPMMLNTKKGFERPNKKNEKEELEKLRNYNKIKENKGNEILNNLINNGKNPNLSKRQKELDKTPFNNLNIYKTSDNIYLDIIQRNLTSDFPLTFNFKEIRNEIIIDNPSNYYLGVDRFTIPSFYTPILTFLPQLGTFQALSQWSITLAYFDAGNNLTFYRAFLPILPNNIFPEIPLGTNITPADYNNPFFYIYDPNTLTISINEAFQTAFNSVVPAVPVDAKPPYITYNQDTRLFTLNAQRDYYLIDPLVPPTEKFVISMNFELSYILTSFNVGYFTNPTLTPDPNGQDVNFIIEDLSNNSIQDPNEDPVNYVYPPPILQNKQQFSSISSWSPIRSFVFTTFTIPINKEFTKIPNINANGDIQNSRDAFLPILTDFEIDRSDQALDPRGNYQFNAGGHYRLVDLVSSIPLKTIDLKIQWLDVYGNLNPVLLRKGDIISVKLVFKKEIIRKKL